MINIIIDKVVNTHFCCLNGACKQDKKYITKENKWLKIGTTCLVIEFNGGIGAGSVHYCGGCIDEMYAYIRGKMDPKLRAFA